MQMMRKPPLPSADLDHFLAHTTHIAPLLRNRRILLTGGTGFFGTWLVECFLHLNSSHTLGAHLTVVTRDSAAFLERSPHLENPALSTIEGDIRSFAFPLEQYAFVIHAATDSVAPVTSSPAEQYSAIVEGTRHVLAFAAATQTERLLFVSSGAVYGPQPRSVLHVQEDDPFQPANDTYTIGKRAAERLCLDSPDVECIFARCFAFIGPHLPLRAHFAAGNFLADALDGIDLEIKGDGTPLRSYLYAADLAVWLWTLLLLGEPGRAYNVGGEEPVSIRALAERTVAVVNPGLQVQVHGDVLNADTPPPRYVPSTQRAREELGLLAEISLDEAIRRTAAWHRSARSTSIPICENIFNDEYRP